MLEVSELVPPCAFLSAFMAALVTTSLLESGHDLMDQPLFHFGGKEVQPVQQVTKGDAITTIWRESLIKTRLHHIPKLRFVPNLTSVQLSTSADIFTSNGKVRQLICKYDIDQMEFVIHCELTDSYYLFHR
jgi:hypothetical protein